MKELKRNKGITLVALIITIIILLILAVVTIRAVTGDGIIEYAKNAKTEYQAVQVNEKETLDNYITKINDNIGGWTQNGITVTDGKTTIEVGDYVDYASGVDGYTDTNGWRVLGVENGQILLMSSKDVVSDYYLEGADDYLNGVAEINSLCTPYGNGEYADSTKTRSVNVDDINKVTGYDPETANYGSGEVYQYGNEVTYTLTEDGKIAYTNDLKSGTANYASFTMPDGSVLGTDMDSVILTSDHYTYAASSYLTDTSSNAYNLIFGSDDTVYWLGSVFKYTSTGFMYFGMRRVTNRNDGRIKFVAYKCWGT